jgi:hypothetical protein
VASCPPIPDTAAGYPDTKDNSFDTVANIFCEEGYIYPDPDVSTVRCMNTGQWSSNITQIFCAVPGKKQKAEFIHSLSIMNISLANIFTYHNT